MKTFYALLFTLLTLLPAGAQEYAWTTLAGKPGGSGGVDGTGGAARFSNPGGVAVDGSGNVYVADTNNHTIRKITSDGVVTTLAGLRGEVGSADGTGNTVRFRSPRGGTVDADGNLYVADYFNHTIRRITPGGEVSTVAGQAGREGRVDGQGGAARFSYPEGVAADGNGNVYAADSGNNTVRKITSDGAVTVLAGTAPPIFGSKDGIGIAAQFWKPYSVTADGNGNVYVADYNNHTIRKITLGGVVTTLAGQAEISGSADGSGGAAQFFDPLGVAVDGDGNVYVADYNNHTVRKITPGGVVTTLAGKAWGPDSIGSADDAGGEARFRNPAGVAVDSDGKVYASDTGNHTIRKITLEGEVTTLAGSAGYAGSADGTGSQARFKSPRSAAIDAGGNMFVADTGNHTIRKITPEGEVTTLSGKPEITGSADGSGGAARFFDPSGVAVDRDGNVYVADTGNHTIWKFTSGGMVTTLAGQAGIFGSVDGSREAARFNRPGGVAVDGNGNVYVADTSNHILRKITPGGEVTTIGGKTGISGGADGTGGAAQFSGPLGLALDGGGTVYVAEVGNNIIRKGTPVHGLSALESWRQLHFATVENSGSAADSFDYDSDGLVNLVEFAFGLDPKAAALAQLPLWQISGGKLAVSFPAPAGVSGIIYGAEWSTSLTAGNWMPVSDEGAGSPHAFGVPVESRARLFVRFKVTTAP